MSFSDPTLRSTALHLKSETYEDHLNDDGQMIPGDKRSLHFPDICLKVEGNPQKNFNLGNDPIGNRYGTRV